MGLFYVPGLLLLFDVLDQVFCIDAKITIEKSPGYMYWVNLNLLSVSVEKGINCEELANQLGLVMPEPYYAVAKTNKCLVTVPNVCADGEKICIYDYDIDITGKDVHTVQIQLYSDIPPRPSASLLPPEYPEIKRGECILKAAERVLIDAEGKRYEFLDYREGCGNWKWFPSDMKLVPPVRLYNGYGDLLKYRADDWVKVPSDEL